MSVTVTSPVEGIKVGEAYTGNREDWLVANGYAARAGDFDGLHTTSVTADKDPTLPQNREAPPVQGGDTDAVAAEDGQLVLSFKQVKVDDPRLEVAPQGRLIPAGLENTDPRVHGTRGIDGVSYSEDKLRERINAQVKAARPAKGNPVLEVAPQGRLEP